MKKIIAVLIVLALMMPMMATPVFAADKPTTGIVNAGNKLCPVSGDSVSGQNFVVYNGKRYGLCCPMCEKPFLANPEKYLATLAEKEKAHAEKKAGTQTSQGMHHM